MDLAVLLITGAAWVLGLLVALGVDLRRSGRLASGYRWRGTGMLLMMTGQAIMFFPSYRSWSYGPRHVGDLIAVPFYIAAMACLIKSGVFTRARPTAADRD